jgi:multidrug resistance efflux pump
MLIASRSLKHVLADAVKAKRQASRTKNLLNRIVRTNLDTEAVTDQMQAVDAAYKRFTVSDASCGRHLLNR